MIEKLGFGRKDSHASSSPHSAHSAHSSSLHIPKFTAVPARQLLVANGERQHILENSVGVPPGTFHDGQYVICDGKFVFTARVSNTIRPEEIGLGAPQREWGQWSLRTPVQVAPFDIFQSGQGDQVYLGDMILEIDFYNRNRTTREELQQKQLADQFIQTFVNKVFSPGQTLALERNGINFRVIVKSTSVVDLEGRDEPKENRRGILLPQSQVTFVKAAGSDMQLKGSGRARANLLQPNFQFQNLGIGGLDKEFLIILRRTFITRMASPQDIEHLGITHVKGMLLYGPPGTGKTLIARRIGKMLGAVEPKIVNGPEMLSKFVGASEENIRKLFKDAEDEYRAKGDDSNLHIIIFDELDAVFKQRGSRGDGTGVGDNLVNQLLSKMDGVNQLNNILVIGMTNRKDLIDPALLRPGRFEVQLEIPLPDTDGRKQIFMIHTQKMRETHLLAPDVDLAELAEHTKNYSGAEIAGVVRAASQSGLARKTKMSQSGNVMYDDKKQLSITREDFFGALQDVRPAFGVSEDMLRGSLLYGIIQYSHGTRLLIEQGDHLVSAAKISEGGRVTTALFHGPAGSGKTAIAASVALNSQFPFVKLVTAGDMISMTEQQKIAHIGQIFADAYRSETSVVVIDAIERVIEWSSIGPRFSNALVGALQKFITDPVPNGNPILVLATTSSYQVLERLGMTTWFGQKLYVNSVSSVDELESVMAARQFLEPQERMYVANEIRTRTGSAVINIGIKSLIDDINFARVSPDSARTFISIVVDKIKEQKGEFSI